MCLYFNYCVWYLNICLRLAILNFLFVEKTQAHIDEKELSMLTEVGRVWVRTWSPVSLIQSPRSLFLVLTSNPMHWSTGRQHCVLGLTLGWILENKASSPSSSINHINFGLSFNICRPHFPNVLRWIGCWINKYPSFPPVLFSDSQKKPEPLWHLPSVTYGTCQELWKFYLIHYVYVLQHKGEIFLHFPMHFSVIT